MVRIFSLFIVIFMSAALSGCAKPPETITFAEQTLIENPGPKILNEVDSILPARLQKQRELEAYILENGRSLTETEITLARAVGVKNANRIRILEAPHIPRRNTAQRLMKGETIRRPTFRISVIGGLEAGYGLVIDEAYLDEEWLLAHELAHVHQFEKLGQEAMPRQVLIEHAVLAGKLIPIESEAIALSEAATGVKPPNYYH